MLGLADTHIALWAIEDSPRLPKKAKALLRNAENDWYISLASIWEVALKHAKKPGEMSLSSKQFYNACSIAGFKLLTISPEHVYRLEFLPALDSHLDPFDRMLLAQAQCEDLVLLTHDQKFRNYQDPRVQVL